MRKLCDIVTAFTPESTIMMISLDSLKQINYMSGIASKSNRLTSTNTVFYFNSFATQIEGRYYSFLCHALPLCLSMLVLMIYFSFSLCWHMWDVLADTSVALEPQRKSILQEKGRNKVLLFLLGLESLFKRWSSLGIMSWCENKLRMRSTQYIWSYRYPS